MPCGVVQDILLYGYGTWVLTYPMMKALEGSHIGFFQRHSVDASH